MPVDVGGKRAALDNFGPIGDGPRVVDVVGVVGTGQEVMPLDKGKDKGAKKDDKGCRSQGDASFGDEIGQALGVVVEIELCIKRVRVGYVAGFVPLGKGCPLRSQGWRVINRQMHVHDEKRK